MKIKLNDNDSEIVKQNETYTLLDNTTLNNLVISDYLIAEGINYTSCANIRLL